MWFYTTLPRKLFIQISYNNEDPHIWNESMDTLYLDDVVN